MINKYSQEHDSMLDNNTCSVYNYSTCEKKGLGVLVLMPNLLSTNLM